MQQYFRIFLQSCKNSWSYLLAYRADFLLKISLGLGWSFFSLAVVEIIFTHTGSFDGWSKTDMILIFFTFTLAIEILNAFASAIESLEEDIRKGQFDSIIIKPIDSQLFTIFRKPDFTSLIFAIAYQLPLLYILIRNHTSIAWKYLPIYIFLIVLANITWVSLKMALMTVNFWWQKLDNLPHLLYTIMEVGRYPVSIFPQSFQAIFYTILPIAFMAVVPANVLRGQISLVSILGAIIVTLCSLTMSRIIWKAAIKNYTSASS